MYTLSGSRASPKDRATTRRRIDEASMFAVASKEGPRRRGLGFCRVESVLAVSLLSVGLGGPFSLSFGLKLIVTVFAQSVIFAPLFLGERNPGAIQPALRAAASLE